MNSENGKDNYKNEIEEPENKRLRKILKKAVNTEKAPVFLRNRIRVLIRMK